MDSLAVESRIVEQLLEGHDCYVCLQPVGINPGPTELLHAVVPVKDNRVNTCGHVTHVQCATSLLKETGRYIEGVWTVPCGVCRFPSTWFETAYCFEGMIWLMITITKMQCFYAILNLTYPL